MKILCWKDKEGRTGHGEPIEDELCDAEVKHMNNTRNSCRIAELVPRGSYRIVEIDPE